MNSDTPEWRPWIVLVGGFLGAGKTSLVLAASKVLLAQGVRCAVILNDQGDELVDTRHVAQRGIASREVTGGCFFAEPATSNAACGFPALRFPFRLDFNRADFPVP